MKKRFNKMASLISLLVIIIMMLTGVTTMLPMYHITHDKAVLFFMLIWVGMLLIPMGRVIVGMVKSKKESLDDMEQYYNEQVETQQADLYRAAKMTVATTPTAKNKKQYKAEIKNAITMMVFGSVVIVPALILSRHIFVLGFAFLWYGLLIYSTVQNASKMKDAPDELPEDMQRDMQGDFIPPVMQRPADMTICPHCGKEVPESFDYCCYCRQKIR